MFTIDTGATNTILSTRVYERIPKMLRPNLIPGGSVPSAADGRRLDHKGSATFELCLGNLCLRTRVDVADIADDVLLGADVLVYGPEGPADLVLSEGLMRLRGISIPLQQVHASPGTFRVCSADHFIVPGMSEMVLDAYVKVPTSEALNTCSRLIVEASPSLTENHCLAVAPTLVDASTNCTVKVRVMNPNREAVSLKQDETLGIAQPALGKEEVVVPAEDEGEAHNFNHVRRLVSCKTLEPGLPIRPTEGKMLEQPGPPIPAHLKEMFDRACDGRTEAEEQEIEALLRQHQEVFSKHDLDLGITSIVEHAIDTSEAAPIKQRPRRVPMAFAGEDREAIQKLLDQGSVRPSTSPWASPLVLVRKRDGSVRPCVDYRAVNAVTTKDAFPLPRTEDCLDAVAGASIFSTLDITSAYNQIPVREADIPKTAFVTRQGLFEYCTMPFGLTNAPATFQRAMEIALSGLQWTTCLIYLDDVIVFGRTFAEHRDRLVEVLGRIRKAGLKLKPGKCQLFRPQVTFLGHVVSGEGVKPDPTNISKVADWPTPSNVTDVRAFLGLGNYYRRFVKDFAEIAKPLTELTKKEHLRSFTWTPACQAALDRLKTCLLGADVMGYPVDDAPFILDTDASEHSIGAVLSQLQDGRERVIAYGSRTLNKAERNYCVTDRELLAVKVFVEQYKHFLLGRHFSVRSDHQALRWLFTLREPKDRVARWIETLSAYDFSVEYRPGNKHGNADGLSRCPDPRNCTCPENDLPLKCGPCQKCQRRSGPALPTRDNDDSHKDDDESGARRVTTRSQTKPAGQPPTKQAPEHPVDTTPMGPVPKERETDVHSRVPPPGGDSAPGDNDPGEGLGPSSGVRPPTQPPGPGQNHSEWKSRHAAAELHRKQKADPDLAPILRWLKAGNAPTPQEVAASSPATRHYWVQRLTLSLQDGVLYRGFTRKNGTWASWQFLVPKSLRDEVLRLNHDSLIAGHLGQKKTRERLLMGFYWFGVREDANNWVRQCDTCSQVKLPTHRTGDRIGEMPAGAPLDRLATDVLGPLPETKRGNRYILVVTDHFTKWVEIFPIPDQTAVTCADRILNEVVARYGCPYDLHSDQGRNYESGIFQELCRLLEVRKTRTSPCNPRCNGQAERFNRTLIRMIKSYLRGEQTDWDLNLGCLAAAYRATPNESTGITPNLLMLGREVRLPAEVMFGSGAGLHGDEVTSYGGYVDRLRQRMQQAHEVAREHLHQRATRQNQAADSKKPLQEYSPGDLAWYLSEMGQMATTPKLRVPYKGPVLVLQQMSPLNYLVQLDADGTRRLIRHDKLKPYEGLHKLPWAKSALARVKGRGHLQQGGK